MFTRITPPQDNLLKFMAKRAITSSPLRNQYPKGGLSKIRQYLSEISLKNDFLKTYNFKEEYSFFLNYHTINLINIFPNGQFKWGSARKALNIYLRDLALQFIINGNPMDDSLKYMEIPLDSYVAKGLKSLNPSLPKFISIKNTKQEDYFVYQNYAYELANFNKTSRIHLDLSFYPVD